MPAGFFFENDKAPYPYIVGLLKGNSIKNEYKKNGRKDSLFAWNIRNYLGDRSINKKIKETATESPQHFFYFNNGITAVCRDYTRNANRLIIEKFQIINGAQTVASLARAPDSEDVMVLFRLIKTKKVDTESGINQDIIEKNNTQNAIKDSDFRANDPIQRWLEKEIRGMKATEVGGKVSYQPKRSSKRGPGRNIRLEEFAKIRYAYLYDPCLIYDSPKLLWTPRSDAGGLYETAFGIDGAPVQNWPKEHVVEALLAIAFHDAARTAAREEKRYDENRSFFNRLRFHVVHLCGVYMRQQPSAPSAQSLLASHDKFASVWEKIWREARKDLNALHRNHVRRDHDPMTLSAFMRSTRIKEHMIEDFELGLDLR